VALTVVLAPVAYVSMFTGFHAYDDEGYFLAALRSYMSGEPLLNPAAPFYGPFYFEVTAGIHKLLGLQPTHDTGRMLTLAIWLLASLAGGLGVYRLVRNAWLAVGAQLATFGVLVALVNEPIEPFGITSLVVVLLVGAAAFRSARPRFTAFLIGASVVALCLIKINIGGFAAIAALFAWSASLPPPWRRYLLPLTAAVMAAVPAVLMVSLLSRDWVLEFAILATLSLAAVGAACLISTPQRLPPSSTSWLALGGALLAVVIVGVAVAGGTTLTDVWNGLVVIPLRLPQLFVLPLTISAGYDVWAIVVMVGSLALLTSRLRPHGIPAGLARVGAGFFTWLVLLLPPDTVFLLALPLAWIATQPPAGDAGNPTDPYARAFLPALALLETLQAYPAAGTQLSMASLAVIPVGAVILNDGVRQLRLAGARRSVPIQLTGWVPRGALGFNVLVFLLFALTATAGFESGTALGLPGADAVRVSDRQAGELRPLVAAIDRDCSSLISLPAMNSLDLWSGEYPPPELRSEIWWLTIDREHQQALVQQLQGQPRLCVVRNQSMIRFWAEGRPVPDGPLLRFIDSSFAPDGTFGDYELLIVTARA
jgi:hypothetical protein